MSPIRRYTRGVGSFEQRLTRSQTRRGRGTLFRVAWSIAVATAVFAACQWEDPFPEYSGINLIEDRGLNVDSFAADHMDGSDPTTFEYVQITTPADFGTTTGLPSGAETTIRRLEAVNLFPDGDFEASVVGAWGAPEVLVNWDADSSVEPPAEDPTTFEVVADGPISGQALLFETSGRKAGTLDLDARALDLFSQGGNYFISFQFVRDDPTMSITLDYGDASTGSFLAADNRSWTIDSRGEDDEEEDEEEEGEGNGATPVETVPTPGDANLDIVTDFYASDTTTNFFYVGSPQSADAQKGHLDNVRLGRFDPYPHVSIDIPLENANGTLPLIASQYRVALYVKSEVADQVTPSENGKNRFRAGQLVVGINDELELVTRDDWGWDADTWVEVSLVFQLEFEDLTNDPPMMLRLGILHEDSLVIGSVLIANPRVELLSQE